MWQEHRCKKSGFSIVREVSIGILTAWFERDRVQAFAISINRLGWWKRCDKEEHNGATKQMRGELEKDKRW